MIDSICAGYLIGVITFFIVIYKKPSLFFNHNDKYIDIDEMRMFFSILWPIIGLAFAIRHLKEKFK